MSNADKVKKVKTAAALAAVAGSMPALVREAIVCAAELIDDHERRLVALEQRLSNDRSREQWPQK